MPAKSRQQYSYALYPLNYLPCSPRLITKHLNYSRAALATDLIKLENVFMRDTGIIDFTLHVTNICFQKNIFIRYSIDNWDSFVDVQCFFKKASIPSSDYYYGVDEFSAMLDSHKLMKDQQDYSHMEFAICYKYNNSTLWNNNNSKNYNMTVHVKATDLVDVLESDSEYSDNKSESLLSMTSATSIERPSKPFKQRYSFDSSDFPMFNAAPVKATLSPQQRPNSSLFRASTAIELPSKHLNALNEFAIHFDDHTPLIMKTSNSF